MQVWWGIYDIAFYILSINWRRKNSLLRFNLPHPMRGVSWTG